MLMIFIFIIVIALSPGREFFCTSYAFFSLWIVGAVTKMPVGGNSVCVFMCVYLCVCVCACLCWCVSSGLNNSHPPIGTHSIIASAFVFRLHLMAHLVSVVRDLIAPACLLRHLTHANPLPSYAHTHIRTHTCKNLWYVYLHTWFHFPFMFRSRNINAPSGHYVVFPLGNWQYLLTWNWPSLTKV